MNLKDIKPKILKNPLQKEQHSKVINLLLELLKFKSITPDDDGALNFIALLFVEFESEFIEKNGTKNLLITKKFGDGKHLCFVGNIGIKKPLKIAKPYVENGLIYGDGAVDMKSGVAAFLGAVLETKKFNGTISILLTSDEEKGIKEVLKTGFKPDYAMLAKPSSKNLFGDTINIGKQGLISGVLTLKDENPVKTLALSLNELIEYELDSGDEYLAPSKFFISGIKTNSFEVGSLPNEVSVMFGVRNSSLTSKEDVYDYIKSKFSEADMSIDYLAKPYVTPNNSKLILNLKESIKRVCDIEPNLSMDSKVSSANYLSEQGIETVEFGVKGDDEIVSVDEVESLYKVFKDLIESFN
ncbi:MAG: succinyl-diaminopimelate desuccinylase [Campylobacteraceae bacterium]|nr:succinyl-diaminopimelate desuccinylase [Campylobacteraceae bacterium]